MIHQQTVLGQDLRRLLLFSHSVVSYSLWLHGLHSMPSFPVLHHLPDLAQIMSIELVMPSNYLTSCHPLLLLSSIFPSIKVFSNELALCFLWPKYWSFSFSISPSNEYSGLISFRTDGLDLLAVQRLSSPAPQFKSISTSVLSLLHGPTLTSINNYWKKHNFD